MMFYLKPYFPFVRIACYIFYRLGQILHLFKADTKNAALRKKSRMSHFQLPITSILNIISISIVLPSVRIIVRFTSSITLAFPDTVS